MVKESSSEEEPLERYLKKTMATPVVGCETPDGESEEAAIA